MILTVPIKILPNAAQKVELLKTIYETNKACDWISDWAFANKVWNQFKIHKLIYQEIRSRFSLSSAYTQNALARVSASYSDKNQRLVQHKFKKASAIPLDHNGFKINKTLTEISIATNGPRLKHIPIVHGKYADLLNKILKKSGQLRYSKGEFYLDVYVDMPDAQPQSISGVMGIDVGITNLATTSTGMNFTGGDVEINRRRQQKLRSKLQKRDTKSAKRHLKKLSGKERRYKRNTNHIISKKIVAEAVRHNVGISLEDLTGINKNTVRGSGAFRQSRGKWAFYELQTFISYKAELAGIPVVKVGPAYTSQTCSNCQHCEKANRKSQAEFQCKKCGMKMNADLNAALNIKKRAGEEIFARLFIDLLEKTICPKPKKKQRSISGAVVNQPIAASGFEQQVNQFMTV